MAEARVAPWVGGSREDGILAGLLIFRKRFGWERQEVVMNNCDFLWGFGWVFGVLIGRRA